MAEKSSKLKAPEHLETLHSTIGGVPLSKMRVSENAQRVLRPARVSFLLENFNLELLGYPVVSLREQSYWIVDGQHRIAALKQFLGAWEGQVVDCRIYTGLNEKQEADMFDWLNNGLAVRAYDRFKTRVTAGRTIEMDVKRIVENSGLHISESKEPNCLSAVSTLVKIASRDSPQTLARTLAIVRDAFGDPGLKTTPVLDGMARLCERYNGQIKDKETIELLNTMRGGVGALMAKAEVVRKQTKRDLPSCVAAAIVDIMNSKRGGKKLPSWWTE